MSKRPVSKYGVFSGSYFPVFSPNTGKHGPEKTPYLDTFHAVGFRLSDIFFILVETRNEKRENIEDRKLSKNLRHMHQLCIFM